MLGFDALGRQALGQVPSAQYFQLVADAGSFALTGKAASFTISEAAVVGTFTLNGQAATLNVSEVATAGTFSMTGKAASFAISFASAPGAYLLTGIAANDVTTEDADPGEFHLTGNAAELRRTGPEYDSPFGGIGHLLMEAERAKQLAAITRKAPPPIDLRSPIRFAPLASQPVAPPAPVVDLSAVNAQRMADEMRAAEQAKKQRRDIEAILLLAC